MPSRIYTPQRNPPNWFDRLMVHPLDTTVGVVAVFFGALVALSLFYPDFTPSRSMDRMPWFVVILVGGSLGNGGVMALIGLYWHGSDVARGWAFERFGWQLIASGFITYSITVSWHYPGSVFSWAVPLSLAVGAILRVHSIVLIGKATRAAVERRKGATDE